MLLLSVVGVAVLFQARWLIVIAIATCALSDIPCDRLVPYRATVYPALLGSLYNTVQQVGENCTTVRLLIDIN